MSSAENFDDAGAEGKSKPNGFFWGEKPAGYYTDMATGVDLPLDSKRQQRLADMLASLDTTPVPSTERREFPKSRQVTLPDGTVAYRYSYDDPMSFRPETGYSFPERLNPDFPDDTMDAGEYTLPGVASRGFSLTEGIIEISGIPGIEPAQLNQGNGEQ